MRTRGAAWLVVVLFAPTTAKVAAARPPGFATLDRPSDDTHLELALGSLLVEDGPTYAGRLDLHGQFATRSRAGGYAALPLSFVIDDADRAALGNLELGGFYVTGGSVPVVLRAGLVLETGEDGPDAVANLLGVFARQTDLISAASDNTWLRVALSPTYSSGRLYLRADAGIDVPFGDDDGPFDSRDPLVRLNLGLGLRIGGGVGVSLEMVNVGATGNVPPGRDRFAQSLGLSVRGTGGPLDPFVALTLPLDDSFANVRGALIVGLRYHVD